MDIRPLGTVANTAAPPNENGPPVAQRTSAPVQLENAVRSAAPVPSTRQLADAVETINKTMQAQAQGVEFTIDAESEKTVVKVVDHETKEVLRQIPSEEVLEIARALDKMQGLLISQKA